MPAGAFDAMSRFPFEISFVSRPKTVSGSFHQKLVYSRRMAVLAAHVSRMIPRDARVLDVGAGDGKIDALIAAAREDLTIAGVDVLKRDGTFVPVRMFDGRTLPFADKSFDVILLVDVLHHTDDPWILLREASRVASRLVIVKDHTKNGPLAGARLSFMDYVGNAHHGVRLPHNYLSGARWNELFNALGFSVAETVRDLGLYPWPANLVFERNLHFIAALRPGDRPRLTSAC